MADELVSLIVRNGRDSHQVSLPANASIRQLMERLQQLTNVHPRGQKLIFKGKVLPSEGTLEHVGVVAKSKILMLASEGVQQGAPKVIRKSPVKPLRDIPAENSHRPVEAMTKSGIFALRGKGLLEVPDYVWKLEASVRVLDLSENSLRQFPVEGATLPILKRLNLTANNLADGAILWRSLCCFKQLTVLALSDNCITCLPCEIGELFLLKHLFLSRNLLETLTNDIGKLQHLETLHIDGNRLKELPFSVGQCAALIEMDLSKNYLKALPSSIGNLKQLKVLDVDNNALKDILPNILKGCTKLDSLSFHGNELTVEEFREIEGWKEYDERRKVKCTKKLALGSVFGGFDEGGDSSRVQHW